MAVFEDFVFWVTINEPMKNKYSDIQNTDANIDYTNDWRKKSFAFPDRTIRLATAFSGIGAIEHAFQRLGLKTEIQFAGDINNDCKKSYFANYEIDETNWFSDINDFSAKPYRGKVDLLVGGAPCQTFSTVGFQRGFDDTRGTLFHEFARVIKECEPKVFIFENVHGLFTHDDGVTWEVIKNTFEDYCGYDIYFQCLNAKNYGIPQRRDRLYCIGFKQETDFKYPQPIPLEYRMYDFLEDYTDSPYFNAASGSKLITPDKNRISLGKRFVPAFNEFVFKCKEVEDKYYISEKVAKYVLASGTKTFKTQVETDCDVARTLLCTMHKMHRSGVDNYVTYKKDKGVNGLRKLTPRECLRLMGFTDDFKIVVSNTSAYQQAGNSIVVDVLIALLKQMDITKYGEDSSVETSKPVQNTKDNIDWHGESWTTRSFSSLEKTVRIGTSFSGIGAIEHAFKRLGIKHEILFAGDIDENCRKSYLANYDLPEQRWHNDIYQFDATPYKGKVDLFVGGAPCQAFSMRGKRGGFEDTRGTLFREFARVLMECEPKVFIFENVKGMLSHDKGNTWKVIKETFERDCGYDVHYQVLNGRNYGIPQSRERIYCIGFRKKTDFLYPAPVELKRSAYDFLERTVPDKYFLPVKGFKFVTEHVNREKMYTQINGDVILCQKRNQQFNWHGDFIFHPYLGTEEENAAKSKLFPVSDGEEKYYIDDSIGKYAVSSGDGFHVLAPVRVNPDSISCGWFRKLTPRECLRLMGFDDSFKIVVPDQAAYQQSGNSIIVDVLIALLKQMDITQYGELLNG